MKGADGVSRCPWNYGGSPHYLAYHDEQWGVPVHDDRKHFELLVLEGAQAGLSWATILNKREGYRKAFAGFDPVKVARFGDAQVERLLGNAAIVRNRLKIASAIGNASAFLDLASEHGSFDAYVWGFVGGTTIDGKRRKLADIPARTSQSDALSKGLKDRGFRFVGSTIVYAYMQAAGLVNDHVVGCFRHAALH